MPIQKASCLNDLPPENVKLVKKESESQKCKKFYFPESFFVHRWMSSSRAADPLLSGRRLAVFDRQSEVQHHLQEVPRNVLDLRRK